VLAPNSVQLRCDGDQATQVVVLTNMGTADIQWQVVFFVLADQVGHSGSHARRSQRGDEYRPPDPLHLSSGSAARAHSLRSRLVSGGHAPTLSYTTSSCS